MPLSRIFHQKALVRHVGIANNDAHLEELRKLAEVIKLKIEEERQGPFLFDMLSFTSQEMPKLTSVEKKKPQASSEKKMVDIKALKEEKRIVDGFHDIFGTLFSQIGFHKILNGKQREVLQDVILARIACPASKSGSQRVRK